MLEQMLKKLFESDKKAASGSGSDHIKAGVLSRIEMERSMNHLRIKPLIVAAAVTVVGIMSVVLTVNASVDKSASEQSPLAYWNSDLEERLLQEYGGDTSEVKVQEEYYRRRDIAVEYYMGKVEQTKANGGIEAEKELDETDVIGYVEPCRMFNKNTVWKGEDAEKQLELIKQLEEDPESLGLIAAGKSETFEGGLRIVTRHFENINEITDKGKVYYGIRRVYTDDAENSLLASIYLGCLIRFPDNENANEPGVIHRSDENQKVVLDILLDHTEWGCLFGFDGEDENHFQVQGTSSSRRMYDENGKGKYAFYFDDYDFKSNLDGTSNENPVTVGVTVVVGGDKIQWLD